MASGNVVKKFLDIPIDGTTFVANSGNDTLNDGTFAKPFATIQAAIAAINLLPPGNYVLNLAPGTYGGAAVSWPANLSAVGEGGFNSVFVNCSIVYTAPTGQSNWAMQGISFADFTIDGNLATASLFSFRDCSLALTYLAGAVQSVNVAMYNTYIRGCSIASLAVMFNCTFTDGGGVNTVQPGGELLCVGSVIGPGIDLYGTAVLVLNGSVLAGVGATGHVVGSDTPTISSDASSINYGAPITSINVSLLDDAQFEKYTPAVPANWIVPPTTVKEALDELASEVPINAERETFVLTAPDIANGYLTLGFAAIDATVNPIIQNAGPLIGGSIASGDDYEMSLVLGVTRVTFAPGEVAEWVVGQRIQIEYWVTPPLGSGVPAREIFPLAAPDIANGYLTLAYTAIDSTVNPIIQGAGPLIGGSIASGDDYEMSVVLGVTRVTFAPSLVALWVVSQRIQIQYWH